MRKSVLVTAAVLVLAAAGSAAVLVRPSQTVPANTFVAGVAVGGRTDEQLTTTLEGQVRDKVEQVITAKVGSSVLRIHPADLGIRLDVAATRAGIGHSWLRWPEPARHDVTPVLVVPANARTALAGRLAEFQQDSRNRSVTLASPRKVLDGKGDLSYTASRRGVTVDEGRAGRAVDAAAGVRSISEAMRAGRTTVTFAVTATEPGDDTPKLAGVDQLIGTFTTYHPCCAPRVTNINRISELVDGTIIPPGGTFSLNDTAGERTSARGFVAAPAIVEGELQDQFGGGVSQFSTTLFNAAWFAGLDIRTHQPHSLYITRYPPGREATLDWRAIDQIIHNPTDTPIVIRVHSTPTGITVALYGHTGNRVVDSVTGPRRPVGTGFAIQVRRTITQDGKETGTDTLNWTYQGLD
ncbi:VanW family protein [Winogradskya humida]|uniref:VanW family protein n=1 Tax=Winogradskya humida TaxID=113566 RepID=UPI001943AB72|nr:VanW family protein [Actinoplanes humidus]